MWKSQVSDWVPFVGIVTGKSVGDSPLLTRFVELIIVGALSAFTTIKALENDVSKLTTRFESHEKQNTEYREKTARDKVEEDRKWDSRIQRLENCFISRTCGVGK